MRGVTLRDVLEQKSEYIVAQYYLSITKNIIICCDINKKKPTFYVWDPVFTIYKNKPAEMLGHMIRKEFIPHIISKMKEYQKKADKLGKLITKLGSQNFIHNLAQAIATLTYKEDFTSRLDSCKDSLNFKNGILDLKTGKFRVRTPADLVSKTLNFKYSEDRDLEKIDWILRKVLKPIANDNDILLQGLLSFLGYSLTGHTSETKGLFVIGPTAANGKSTLAKIMESVFDIYVTKLNNEFFDKGNTKRHKQLHEIQKKRLVYLEELSKKLLDADFLKDFIDGNKIGGNEVLYGTVEDIHLTCKLLVASNYFPSFPTDMGMERRGLLLELTNKFIDEGDYNNLKDKKGYYIKIRGIENKFKMDDKLKLAFIHILLPFAIEWYKKGLTIPKEFENSWGVCCEENDNMKAFINATYIETGNDNDRIGKEDFSNAYNNYIGNKNGKKLNWNNILNDIKRLGLKYKRLWRGPNGCRGCIVGLISKNNQEDIGIDEKKEEEQENKEVSQKEEIENKEFIEDLKNRICNMKPKTLKDELTELLKEIEKPIFNRTASLKQLKIIERICDDTDRKQGVKIILDSFGEIRDKLKTGKKLKVTAMDIEIEESDDDSWVSVISGSDDNPIVIDGLND